MRHAVIAILLLTAIPALGQAGTTAVTAQVKDSNGTAYVNCKWSVIFVGQSTTPGAGPYAPASLLNAQQAGCDSFGNFSVNLADNINTVTPTPSQWQFTITSANGYTAGPYSFTVLITITGASQNITSTLTAAAPLLPTINGGGTPGGSLGFAQSRNSLGQLGGEAILWSDQFSGANTGAKMDAAAATTTCSTGPGCVIFTPPNSAADSTTASSLPTASPTLFIDWRKLNYLLGSKGPTDNVIGIGTTSRLFTINDYTQEGVSDPEHSTMVIQTCLVTFPATGKCLNGGGQTNIVNSFLIGAARDSSVSTAALQPFNILMEMANTLVGSGQTRAIEGDIANTTATNFTFNSTTNGGGIIGDTYNTGDLQACVSTGGCGIGFVVGTNTPGTTGNWERGMLVRDWNSDGVGIHMVWRHLSGSSVHGLVLDSDAANIAKNLEFWDNATAEWALGITTAQVLQITDPSSAVRLQFPVASGVNVLGTSNQLAFTGNAHSTTLNVANPSANRTIKIADAGANSIMGTTLNATSGTYQSVIGSANGCTTGSSAGNACASAITITFPASFPDTSYAAGCGPVGAPTNFPSTPYVVVKSAGSMTVNYIALTAAAASWPAIDCWAVHQ